MNVWEQIREVMVDVAEARDGAWERLVVALHPELEAIARRQPLGRLRGDEDVHRDIVTKVLGKLFRDDHRVIGKFVDHADPPPLEAWVRLLVRNAAIDVMRGRPEYIRGRGESPPGWLSLATLATLDGHKPPNSILAKRREVEAFLANAVELAGVAVDERAEAAAEVLAASWKIPAVHTRRLIKHLGHYRSVLSMVFAGHSLVEIGEALGKSRREVGLIISYLEDFFHASGFADGH